METDPTTERTKPKRTPVPFHRTSVTGLGNLIHKLDVSDEEIDTAAYASIAGGKQDESWNDATVLMMRGSCAFFAEEVLQGPPEAPYNGKFLIGRHHEEWDDLITSHDRLCVLSPRDSGKTFFFDFAYPIWKSYFNPRTIGFIFSATKDQASRILMDIKQELENNPKLRWLVPYQKKVWSNSHIQLANGSHIYARGFGTRVRGAHPHWIVVDDCLNDETAYSATVRSKQNDYFFSAISNMVVPGGQLVIVGTPFAVGDLYSELEKNEAYVHQRYQSLSKNGEPLWPDRYDKARLEAKRLEIGNLRFNREFQCVAVDDSSSLFPRYLFIGEPVEQPTVRLGAPLEFWEEEVGIVGSYMGCDLALSTSVSADWSVNWVVGLDKLGNRWIMDIDRHRGLPFQEQLSRINSMGQRYKPGLVYIESNQAQRIFGDELIRTTDLPIRLFVTGVQRNSLDKGIPSLRVLLENKKFRIPRGDARSVELTDLWISEMQLFTFQEGKVVSIGQHDDIAMASWICDQACRMGAFTFTFGDENEYESKQQLVLKADSDDKKYAPTVGLDGYTDGSEDDNTKLFDDNSFASPFPKP